MLLFLLTFSCSNVLPSSIRTSPSSPCDSDTGLLIFRIFSQSHKFSLPWTFSSYRNYSREFLECYYDAKQSTYLPLGIYFCQQFLYLLWDARIGHMSDWLKAQGISPSPFPRSLPLISDTQTLGGLASYSGRTSYSSSYPFSLCP